MSVLMFKKSYIIKRQESGTTDTTCHIWLFIFLQEKKNLESIIAVTDSKSVYNAFFKLPS